MQCQEEYRRKICTPEQIAMQVENGWVCCTDIAAAIPTALMDAIGVRAISGRLKNVTLHMLLDLQSTMCLTAEAARGITPVSWFSGSGLRAAVNEGRGDIMPCHYRDMPDLFNKFVDVDALFLLVSPMDEHGYFSSGASASNLGTLLRKARRIYLEVNPNVPRTLTAPQVHITQTTALCESNRSLPLLPPAEIDEISKVIGGLIAGEVPNGATLQLGVGAIPEAAGLAMRDKHDLGIHTELFTESMVELIECGAVTNEQKPIHKGKTVATLTFGSQRVYDFIHENPTFLLLPVDQVNDPNIIAQHPDFISVNAAIEVDFFGQVCAESVGTRHVSGSGGQADYVRGAVQSHGGKSFIAFVSTAKGETVSKICPILRPGALVTTSKNDVDYIVTEYGVAKLRGKTLSQRAKALIGIAHPRFREELRYEAKKMNIII